VNESLMSLIDELVHIESTDAATADGSPGSWPSSDRARAARAAVEQRIEAIEDAAIQIGVDGETISALLDGTE
jgi:hypothetical protein